MTPDQLRISRHTLFVENIESGLIYEFADRYWAFRLRPLEHMDVFFEPTGKDSRRAVEGSTQ